MPLRPVLSVTIDNPAPPLAPGLDDRGAPEPVVEWGDPLDLWIDDAYQRAPSEKSLKLVRKVGGGQWDWSKFTPPTVVKREVDGVEHRCLIDGQHTAMMAASRGIRRIPWLLVQTVDQAADAKAFVGKNRDKTGITALQEHKAAVSAGDEDALTIDQVMARAGVTLSSYAKPTGEWKAGETVSVAAIGRLIKARHALGARKVLELLVQAELAPITAKEIQAVDTLLNGEEFKGQVKPERLVELLRDDYPEVEREAGVFAATHRVPYWRGLTVTLFRMSKRRAAA